MFRDIFQRFAINIFIADKESIVKTIRFVMIEISGDRDRKEAVIYRSKLFPFPNKQHKKDF